MDPTTLAFASATVLFFGNVAQFLHRLMSDPKPAPVLVQSEDIERLVKGKIYEHEVHCHIGEVVMARIEANAKMTREDLQQYRKDLGERLDRIEAQIARHIEHH